MKRISRMRPPSATWKNSCRRNEAVAVSFIIHFFTIHDGPFAGQLRGCASRRIICSRAPDRVWFKRIYDRLQWTLGVALLNLFPLPRQSGFRKSFAYAGEAVDRGYSVL